MMFLSLMDDGVSYDGVDSDARLAGDGAAELSRLETKEGRRAQAPAASRKAEGLWS
jgi:hypothetical protein